MCKRPAAEVVLWALATALLVCSASARASASAVGPGGRSSEAGCSRRLSQSGRRALAIAAEAGVAAQAATAASSLPSYSGLTAAWPPSLRQSVAAGAAAESSSAAAAQAASASLSQEVRATLVMLRV